MFPLHPAPSTSSSTPPPTLPTLSTHPTTHPPTQTAALKLIADSIAQQRQLASRALLTHPLPLSLLALLLALLARFVDAVLLFTTAGGVVMLGLVGVRAFTGVYLVRAEGVGLGWLEGERKGGEGGLGEGEEGEGKGNGNGKGKGKGKGKGESVVVITVWGEQVIATVVLSVVESERKAWVRAWTTMLRYRGAGVGRGVLEEAVKVAVRGYGCREVVFGEDHASEF